MKIITVSGLDGSGKSTQIEMLKNYLGSLGKKVFYFHAVQFGIGKLGKGTVSTASNKSIAKANWLQIQLRKLALAIDLCRFRKLIKKLEKEGYDYLVSDRYFYDSMVNIEYLSDSSFRGWTSKKLEVQPLKPDLSIYLSASPETIMSRERIPDQGIEYLQKKKELYDQKTSVWSWKVIDGNRDKNVIFEEIKNYVTQSR
jgi:dTMP kinase